DTTFTWVYNDREGKKVSVSDITPTKFYRDYCNIDFNDYVVIVNDPRPRHPYEKMYEMTSTHHMVIDKLSLTSHLLLNLDNNEIIKLIMKQIDDKIPVWFACDITKYTNHKYNIMDVDMYNYGLPFDTSFSSMSKSDRLDFYDSYPCHAMTIIGYDIS